MSEKVQEFLGNGSKLGVKREVKDFEIIAAGGSGSRFKTPCPVEYVRPSDDELERLRSSCDVFVLPSFREGLYGPTIGAPAHLEPRKHKNYPPLECI